MDTPSPSSTHHRGSTDPARLSSSPGEEILDTPADHVPVVTVSAVRKGKQPSREGGAEYVDPSLEAIDPRPRAEAVRKTSNKLDINAGPSSSSQTNPDDLRSPINLTVSSVPEGTSLPEPHKDASAWDRGKVYNYGRDVFVSPHCSIRKGETILRCEPIAQVLNDKLLLTHCSGCFNDRRLFAFKESIEWADSGEGTSRKGEERTMLPCGRCQKVVFCSVRCYAKTFEEHALECRALLAAPNNMPTEVRLLVKVIRSERRRQLRKRDLSMAPPDESSELAYLAHLVHRFLGDFETARIRRLDWSRFGMRSQDDLTPWIRQVLAATFPVQDPLGANIGLCVSPDVSNFRHECQPTAFIAFPDGVDVKDCMYVVACEYRGEGDAVRSLFEEANQRQLSISYVNRGFPMYLRDAVLRGVGFEHFCDKCRSPQPDIRACSTHDYGCGGNMHISRPNMPSYLDLRCDGCRQPVVQADTGPAFLRPIGSHIVRELQGSLPSSTTPNSFPARAMRRQLDSTLLKMGPFFPATYWPLPYLYRRSAMFTINNPTSTAEELGEAAEFLDQAIDAMDEWYGHDGSLECVYLWILKAIAHERARMILEERVGVERDPDAIRTATKDGYDARHQAQAVLMLVYGHRRVVGWLGRYVAKWRGGS